MKAQVYGLLVVATVLAWAPAAVPQALPHGIPDLCASDPGRLVIDAPASQPFILSGTHACVEVRGAAIITGTLRAVTVLVYPGGDLTLAAGSTTIIRDQPIDTVRDPEQWGHGLVVVDGRLRAAGQAKTPFARLAAEIVAGQSSVTLFEPVTAWAVGERVSVADTRELTGAQQFAATLALQHETKVIAAVSPDGRTVTMTTPFAFTHRGARNANGTPAVLPDGTPLLPHVANLTRATVIRSENPAGVRGHVAFVGAADVDVRGVAFLDLGRTEAKALDSTTFSGATVTRVGTNQVGRYALHVHHLYGPVNPTNTGFQFTLAGNVIEGSRKWPLAIHASHYGLIEDNVIDGAGTLAGAGLALEDGSETDNLIRHNYVGAITGNIPPRASGLDTLTPGTGGECYWAAGFNNRFVDNVAAGCRNAQQQPAAGAGFKFFRPAQSQPQGVPRFRGDRPASYVLVQPQRQPIPEFRRNEVYGLAAAGVTFWQLNTTGYDQPTNVAETLLQDLRVWHVYDAALWAYPINRVTLDGLQMRCDPTVNTPFACAAVTASDYRIIDLTIRNSEIHARSVFFWDTDPLGTFLFENVTAVTREAAYIFRTPSTSGTFAKRTSGVDITIRGGSVRPFVAGQPVRVAQFLHTTQFAPFDTVNPYRVTFENYQGTGQAFRAFFPQQATQVIYGEQAPAGATTAARPEIAGLTSDLAAPPPANRAPTVALSCGTCATLVGDPIVITAVGSDPDGDALGFLWTGAGQFTNAQAAQTTWTGAAPGAAVLTMTVDDGRGGTAAATVSIAVTAPPPPPPAFPLVVSTMTVKDCTLAVRVPVPPAALAGYGAQLQRALNGGTPVSHGTRITTFPASRSATVVAGAWTLSVVWTKSGAPALTQQVGVVQPACGG